MSSEEPSGLPAGKRLGHFEIVEAIGAGGMGQVYRAKDTRLGRDVAIKILPPELASAAGFRERFEREARTISSLNHPHICVLHDIGHLIIYMRAGAQAREALTLARERGRSLVECEQEVMGFDHAEVGRTLLDRWNFPGAFREAVAYHHRPSLAGRYPVEAAAVHVAEVVAHAMAWGRSGETFVPPFDPQACHVLGLTPENLPVILADVERQLEAVTHVMGAAA